MTREVGLGHDSSVRIVDCNEQRRRARGITGHAVELSPAAPPEPTPHVWRVHTDDGELVLELDPVAHVVRLRHVRDGVVVGDFDLPNSFLPHLRPSAWHANLIVPAAARGMVPGWLVTAGAQ